MFIAEQCGLDIGEVLVKLDMEKAKSPAVREALGSVLKRIAGAVAAIALITGLMTTPASDEGPNIMEVTERAKCPFLLLNIYL
ncbi:hypothetical protein GCM10009098_07390 [Rheinheimera aquimaris]|uniref:Uncharacterized protein n=1 Tax=Rheinheimera aquimaris TaxID=412437 RepID=A0ABP3NH18_9GAMM|nr:hypothetical protein [Rheinheimera aquimaris]MCB5212088.1 hypothetical protein [Rheinheimera aquimaris]